MRMRAAATREFHALLSVVARHFNLSPESIDAAKRAALSNHTVLLHALNCYRAIVRSL